MYEMQCKARNLRVLKLNHWKSEVRGHLPFSEFQMRSAEESRCYTGIRQNNETLLTLTRSSICVLTLSRVDDFALLSRRRSSFCWIRSFCFWSKLCTTISTIKTRRKIRLYRWRSTSSKLRRLSISWCSSPSVRASGGASCTNSSNV